MRLPCSRTKLHRLAQIATLVKRMSARGSREPSPTPTEMARCSSTKQRRAAAFATCVRHEAAGQTSRAAAKSTSACPSTAPLPGKRARLTDRMTSLRHIIAPSRRALRPLKVPPRTRSDAKFQPKYACIYTHCGDTGASLHMTQAVRISFNSINGVPGG